MKNNQSALQWCGHFVAASLLALGLAGCSGDDGSPGAAGAPGPGVAPIDTATALNITITAASVNSAPVVNFKVTNQDGVAVAGLTSAMLRFNIAKLVPGTNGAPDHWQNYIYRATGGVYGSQERSSGTGYRYGTLVNNLDGTYTYTFSTNITNPADIVCPSPCTDAQGVALDLSYNAGLTHRVAIQVSGTTASGAALPYVNATQDFVPSGGALRTRDIVKTETCNECHGQLRVHGSRIEAKLCVTCHNQGSWVAATTGTDAQPIRPVDFKVMIHKIHQGEELPSVKAGTKYKIGNSDYSTVVFPYSAVALGDTRACAKCHDGAVTAQGDNWKNVPSKAACSACHDDVYFGNAAANAWETVSHIAAAAAPPYNLTVAPDPTDDTCIQCHGAGQVADTKVKHDLPNLLKAEAEKYQYNIVAICGVAVGSKPICAPGVTPTVKFSVTNPKVTPATLYNIKTDPAFACVNGTGLPASVSMLMGWNNTDENNVSSGSNPAQPLSASVLNSYSAPNCSNNANVVDNGDGTFTLTFTGKTIPASGVSGSGRAALYGRVTKDVDGSGAKNVRIKAAYKDFGITDTTPVARRSVVDIAKCDKCHDQVSLHGDSRTNEPGLCVMCHNPNATDVSRRPKGIGTGGLFPDPSLTLDTKAEESVDFKRLIHGIHRGEHRDKGLVVWGYPGAGTTGTCTAALGWTCQHNFGEVRFPGILNNCTTCHLTGTYELTGKWEVPTASGILGSTTSTVPNIAGVYATELADHADDLNISPTAAVCSACHDGAVAKSHMALNGAQFDVTQTVLNSGVALEACAICHGPGRLADVKIVHGVK